MKCQFRENADPGDPRRQLMAVYALLEEPRVQGWVDAYSRPLVLDAIREALDWFRQNYRDESTAPDLEAVLGRVKAALDRDQAQRLRPVINATGIILHTGLGRAVLPQTAVDAVAGLNRGCNLQIDLETGLRGKRDFMCAQLLCKLTGAEAATLVNNNAAATFLILAALSQDKEVIISRGQLIEIGGSFRLPDCIRQSGARMVEIGTTNKTHLRDYENAMNENTGMILRVNPSNYRVVGFSKEVPVQELVGLKKIRPVLIVDDLGCGALIDLQKYGLPKEPTVAESIKAGADLVCFSGDKLIGGPQAGIIVGKKEWIDRLKKHPLSRMLRVGKLTDLALEHTLRLFLDPDSLPETNPTYAMLARPVSELRASAERLRQVLSTELPGWRLEVVDSESATGGGALPAITLPSCSLALESPQLSADDLSRALRQLDPPIIGRIHEGHVELDLRTLLPGDENLLVAGIKRLK
jgi:L-seryl-tRNA(Ser) seleniumtransferase